MSTRNPTGWTRYWEEFSGHKYVKPGEYGQDEEYGIFFKKLVPKTCEIRDMVKDAQDILRRMSMGKWHKINLDWLAHQPKQIVRRDTPQDHGWPKGYMWSKTNALEWVGTECQYPQTLGELCLELDADGLRANVVRGVRLPASRRIIHPGPALVLEVTPKDRLRVLRAMYHKNTNPHKEKRTQKAEKLIIMVGKEMGLYRELHKT
jgi:hypothetical protein